MLIQNCSFEGDEILFISVLAVTNGETAWFRVIGLMAHLCCSPFWLVCRLRNGSRAGHHLLGHSDWWRKMTQTNQSKPFSGFFKQANRSGMILFWKDLLLPSLWRKAMFIWGGKEPMCQAKMLYKMGSVMPLADRPAPLLPCTASTPFHSVRNHPGILPLILFYVLSVACK